MLAEFGLGCRIGGGGPARAARAASCDGRLPPLVQRSLQALREHLRDLDARIAGFDRDIAQHARSSASAQRLGALVVWALTASAVVATVGTPRTIATAASSPLGSGVRANIERRQAQTRSITRRAILLRAL